MPKSISASGKLKLERNSNVLTLQVRHGDRIFIADNIIVTAIFDGPAVRLAFSAPREVKIDREKVLSPEVIAAIETASGYKVPQKESDAPQS